MIKDMVQAKCNGVMEDITKVAFQKEPSMEREFIRIKMEKLFMEGGRMGNQRTIFDFDFLIEKI